MPPLTLLIKPVSSDCNMRCNYCFYADEKKYMEIASYGLMSYTTLENVVIKALAEARWQCTFAFQGGEPTLAGLNFYEKLLELVNKHNRNRIQIKYLIQTNGYSIDKNWAVFLKQNNFLVGLSLDGIKDTHDLFRRDVQGKGTFSNVMRASQIFDNIGVSFNILTVVTAQVVKNIGKIYGFFGRNRFLYQQYIPCLDPLYEKRGQHSYSLSPQLYGEFLCTLFDLWYNDFIRGKQVYVRYFDNLIHMLMGNPPESCVMAGHCSPQIVVESDGSVYPCDFYVLDEYRLGNLNENDIQYIESKRDEIKFIELSKPKNPQCTECQWLSLCRGGCRRDRECQDNSGLLHNYFCTSYKLFFNYAYSRMISCVQYFQEIH